MNRKSNARGISPLAMVSVLAILLGEPVSGLAQRLPDTSANRARGVVGCIQTTTGITCPGAGGGGSLGSVPGGSFEQQLLGTVFSSLMQGFMQGMQDTTQQRRLDLQQQQELERQRKALEEELARRESARKERERKAREEFEQQRNHAYGLLKGPKATEFFGLKGVGNPAELGIKDIGPARDRRDVSTPWKALQCSAYLSKKAEAAARSGNEEEAAYLSEQAAQAMSGGTIGVQCPEAPSPPTPYGSTALLQSETPQVQFYSALVHSVKGSLDQLAATNEQLEALHAKKEEAARKVHVQQQEVARLQQLPPTKSGAPPLESNLLEEAQRLLDEAIRDEAGATNRLQEATQRQHTLIQAIKDKETLFQKVQADSRVAGELLPLARE